MFAKKSLGQNFLMHPQIAARIVAVSGVGEGDTVFEIGPGTGMLTRELLKKASKVIAIEADHTLIDTLRETFATELKNGRLTLIQGDVRTFDPEQIPDNYALVANIPYYLTGEIIRTFLEHPHAPTSMTLLVQKEVAERIARSTKESLLSLSVKVYGTPEYCFTVPRGAFRPAPNVDSAVLAIRNISKKILPTQKEGDQFFTLIHAGFAHKRKQLGKNLEETYGKEAVDSVFKKLSIERSVRAETLSLSTWTDLARLLARD